MEDSQPNEDVALETPVPDVFVPPSVHEAALISGDSYTYFSPVPSALLPDDNAAQTQPIAAVHPSKGVPCVLGVDEAGRGPVLGPMVYGVFFLPVELSDSLLRSEYHFDDSKALTPAVRSSLMAALCDPASSLHRSCGWAVSALSARDIGAGMLRGGGGAQYNLNAQALDATVALIRGVYERGVNVTEIYVDTVGPPLTHQKKLEREFPTARITVAKKADSLFPCVSAASVCAKVTRDACLEVLYRARAAAGRVPRGARVADAGGNEEQTRDEAGQEQERDEEEEEGMAWGSGYPSDGRCVAWLRSNMHPVFGWGPECRFSWGTAKDMLETKGKEGTVLVEWPADEDHDNNTRVTDFFVNEQDQDVDELGTWFGTPAGVEAF
ncbi:hypothetical protein VTK73DRAFT_4728 [Phialemonium thermophilum]|uniref:Ribonuclease n=1 Tax=Phialemonium thermophilum TaxID=223376 RepID=A0ABR3WS85_9PEZI